ncbi:MAG: SAF domain-containing protein [Clostridia bacterium]|nr:SAF domain-containing protein [Clostridia bacterium]
MAMNPMQRRARNSFLTGMLVTLVVMAVVVIALLYKINQLNEDKEKLIALQKKIYVAAEDIPSGGEITEDLLKQEIVQTTVDSELIFTADDFMEIDEDGNEFVLEYISKVDLPKGTIITKDMVAEAGDETTDDQRIQEYNMFMLPSELKNGQYIDIRFKLPNGADYIVASKKKVLQCTADTVWLKVDETEILSIGCAIVESYKTNGSKLYATTYSEAGLQAVASTTYTPNNDVWDVINRDPNILQEAKNALANKYNAEEQGVGRIKIDSAILDDPSAVQSGIQKEATSLQTAREAFVEALEGTGEVGSTSVDYSNQ